MFTKNILRSQILFSEINGTFPNFKSYTYDIVVAGGGIIGTAVAKTIKEKINDVRIALLEKEHEIGLHQSSHNSNVIHAGIYYKPNSLKAQLCVKGADLIYDYCQHKNIPVKKCGKLIIATDRLEIYRLSVLYQRGIENKVPGLTILNDWNDVREIQPNCNGLRALWSPNTGNVEWKTVTQHFASDFKQTGGHIYLNCKVKCIEESTLPDYPLAIKVEDGKVFHARYAVVCLGLHSGTLFDNDQNDYKNISLKVNYQLLNPKLKKFIKTNIYAMPNIDMPFIGVHISPLVNGSVLLGPSAVPALKLDGYKSNEFDVNYLQNNVFSKGFGLLFVKNFQTCFNQVAETLCGDVRTQVLNKYFPMVCKSDVLPGPSGVQGQVVTNDGEFLDDFVIEMFEGGGIRNRLINCRFIPSPGATCSLALAHLLHERIVQVYTHNL